MKIFAGIHLFLLSSSLSATQVVEQNPIYISNVELLPTPATVSSVATRSFLDVGVRIFKSTASVCSSDAATAKTTWIAVHGLAHTSTTWKKFADSLLGKPVSLALDEQGDVVDQYVCRLAAVDLAGRGLTSLPKRFSQLRFAPVSIGPGTPGFDPSRDGTHSVVNLPIGPGGPGFDPRRTPPRLYGELLLEDHVITLINAIEGLRKVGIKPDVIVGHSQGALLVQMAQELLKLKAGAFGALGNNGVVSRLLGRNGDSLNDLGINRAVLLAPSLPKEISWGYLEHPLDLSPFVSASAEMGQFLALPNELFPSFFFTNADLGTLSPLAPSVAEVTSHQYNSAESLAATLELMRVPVPGIPELSVSGELFGGNDVKLSVIAFAQDMFVTPDEQLSLFNHLVIAGEDLFSFFNVIGEGQSSMDAVHDSQLSNPDSIVEVLQATLRQ